MYMCTLYMKVYDDIIHVHTCVYNIVYIKNPTLYGMKYIPTCSFFQVCTTLPTQFYTEHFIINCVYSYIHMYVLGIGQGRVTDNLSGAPVDSALLIPDTDVVAMVRIYTCLCMSCSMCKCVEHKCCTCMASKEFKPVRYWHDHFLVCFH